MGILPIPYVNYENPAWLVSLAASKITGTLAKSQQHAQTAYKDEAGTWAQAQTFRGDITVENVGGDDLILGMNDGSGKVHVSSSNNLPLSINPNGDVILNRVSGTVTAVNGKVLLSQNNGMGYLRLEDGTNRLEVVNVGNWKIGSNTNTPVEFHVNNTEQLELNSSSAIFANSIIAVSEKVVLSQNNNLGSFRLQDDGTNQLNIVNVGNWRIAANTNIPIEIHVNGSEVAEFSSTGATFNGNISCPQATDGERFGSGGSVANYSTSVGKNATCTTNGVAVGAASSAAHTGVAVGWSSIAGSSATALGTQATAIGTTIAIGYQATTANLYAVALGNAAEAAFYSTALGYAAKAPYSYSIALGAHAENTTNNQLTIGSLTAPISQITFPGSNNVTIVNPVTFNGSVKIGTKTIATLPSAASSVGERYQVSDSATIANRIAFSNGSAWYYEGTAVAV